MVSFSTLAVCLGALVSVCSAHNGHAHLHRRGHLQARAGFNGTATTLLPVPIGTGAIPPPAEYTTTVTQTKTELVTLTYTLGNGVVKTTAITKVEESVETIARVKSTKTVAPIYESTAPVAVETPVVSSVPAPVEVVSDEPKSTSTTTKVITIVGDETATVNIVAETAPAVAATEPSTSSAVAACSAETVYVPQYVTIYSTVTVSAVPNAVHTPIVPPYSNNTMTSSTISYESTSTTTLSVYTTVYVKPSAV